MSFSLFPWISRLFWLCLAMAVAGCANRPASLANDAYIWQRQWTPALLHAMAEDGQPVRAWRVLAGEMDGQGRWRMFTPDWNALAASGKPVVAVVRIEGQLQQWNEAALLADVQSVLATWRQQKIVLAGVEIDHDCATSRLPAYAHFLQALRPSLLLGERLSVTALPTWLDSPRLDALLDQVDEAVLQVHAVQSPRAGLFNPDMARAWMTAFARHTRKPWRVALPAYGTRVSWDAQGRVSAIESERPTLVGDEGATELFADPRAMQRFVASLEANAPHGLAGIVWFRLPTGEDARAWSGASWRSVLGRVPLQASLTALATGTEDAHRYDVWLVNEGDADMPLPPLVRIEGACAAADGINGYVLQRGERGLYLQRTRVGVLRAGRQLAAGWLRCDDAPALRIES
ncbi:Protein of unknown function [Dyella jiangningensis]|uniref:DUF3142 domain-containing protein n=1 Tax=Dyella sp. AtDHG13 TaxID=1938897 RepID=UPI00089130F8|nr:DUF3142 domain-containing protein [Dyella sp. AtDHG13]PXV58284.1 uncharacterized protein DUF3142 [Dyella sp. AtDHG13]SDK08853.1 Protein of unknown function [Dyella jiangningensis]